MSAKSTTNTTAPANASGPLKRRKAGALANQPVDPGGKPGALPTQAVLDEVTTDLATVATKLGIRPAVDAATRKSMTAEGIVTTKFVTLCMTVAAHNPTLVGTSFNAKAAQEDTAYINGMTPVTVKTRAVLKQQEDEIMRRKASLGANCRHWYKQLGVLAESPEGAAIVDSVAQLAALMKKPRKAKTPAVVAPVAPVVPVK